MERIQSFDSWDEMQRVMQEAEDQANSNLHPRQVELRDNFDETTYWVRPFPDGNCLIFGEVYSYKEACEASAKYVPDRTDEMPQEDLDEAILEAIWEIRRLAESRERGYLYGWAYSIIEPEGEIGSTHVANAWPISRDAFEEARATGWRAIRTQDGTGSTPLLNNELEALDAEIRAMKRDGQHR